MDKGLGRTNICELTAPQWATLTNFLQPMHNQSCHQQLHLPQTVDGPQYGTRSNMLQDS
jgi:hypothetical protein